MDERASARFVSGSYRQLTIDGILDSSLPPVLFNHLLVFFSHWWCVNSKFQIQCTFLFVWLIDWK